MQGDKTRDFLNSIKDQAIMKPISCHSILSMSCSAVHDLDLPSGADRSYANSDGPIVLPTPAVLSSPPSLIGCKLPPASNECQGKIIWLRSAAGPGATADLLQPGAFRTAHTSAHL